MFLYFYACLRVYNTIYTGPLTVFGPSDKAFGDLTREDVQKLLLDETYLRATLRRHVLAERVSTSDFGADILKDNFSGEKTRLNFYKKTGTGDVRS